MAEESKIVTPGSFAEHDAMLRAGNLEKVREIVAKLAQHRQHPGRKLAGKDVQRALIEFLWRGGDPEVAELQMRQGEQGKKQPYKIAEGWTDMPDSRVTKDHELHARAIQLALSKLQTHQGHHGNMAHLSDTSINEAMAASLLTYGAGQTRFTSVQVATHDPRLCWAIAEVDPSPLDRILAPDCGGWLYIGIRGTSSLKEVLKDMLAKPTSCELGGKTHKGEPALCE